MGSNGRNYAENDKLYSELLLYINGAHGDDFSGFLLEAENAMDNTELGEALFKKCKALSEDIASLDGRIDEGTWAYRQKGTDERGKPFEFVTICADFDSGFILSFCYEKDILVLERTFYKDGD